MKNEMQIFNFNEMAEIRTVNKSGEVWFVATDIAKALEFASAKDMTRVCNSDV